MVVDRNIGPKNRLVVIGDKPALHLRLIDTEAGMVSVLEDEVLIQGLFDAIADVSNRAQGWLTEHGLRAALRAVLDRRPQVTKRRAVLRRLIDGRGLVARSDAPARRPGVEFAVATKGRDRETRQAPPSDASGRHVLDAA